MNHGKNKIMFEIFEIKTTIKETFRPKSEDEISRQKVRVSLEQVGFRELLLHEEITNRLTLLEKGSKFNEYSRRIERGMGNVLSLLEKQYAEKYPEAVLSKNQRHDGSVAAILHDVGKSGPVEATAEEQGLIIEIFARENIRNSNALVSEIACEMFPMSQLAEILETLDKYKIGGKTTMREFWDWHAQWTHDILEKYPQNLNAHVRMIAGSHHIDRGVNPYHLPDEAVVPLAANVIGTMEEYVEALEGRALIALDQYEAAIERGKLSHEMALSRIRSGMVRHKNDKLMNLVLGAIDELGGNATIFS